LILCSMSLGAILILAVCGWRVIAVAAEENPHELVVGASGCGECHVATPDGVPEGSTRTVLPEAGEYVADHVEMCVSCHKDDASAHPIGAKPGYPVPADLPLDEDGRISCLTCHFTHGNLKSDHRCCSASLLDRLFARDRFSKSFLLRRDNPKGQLCQACHGENRREEGQ
jgi:hypothetical protein